MKQGRQQEPFLLIGSFFKPHDAFNPAERFANSFRPEDMTVPVTWGKVNLASVPAAVRKSIEYNAPTPELREPAQARRHIAYYYANLAQRDEPVGTVLPSLQQLSLEDNTIVVYTSGHGEMPGEHGPWQKLQLYESSCGVPLLLRALGLLRTDVCRVPFSQVGLLPSLAELANVPVSSRIAALQSKCASPQQQRELPVFAECNPRTRGATYMVRSGDHKYTLCTHDIPELYALGGDPQEINTSRPIVSTGQNRGIKGRIPCLVQAAHSICPVICLASELLSWPNRFPRRAPIGLIHHSAGVRLHRAA